jgi:hypothetical protein
MFYFQKKLKRLIPKVELKSWVKKIFNNELNQYGLTRPIKNLFPDHDTQKKQLKEVAHELYVQKEPMICKFEKEKEKSQP